MEQEPRGGLSAATSRAVDTTAVALAILQVKGARRPLPLGHEASSNVPQRLRFRRGASEA